MEASQTNRPGQLRPSPSLPRCARLKHVKEIDVGKPYLLQCIRFTLLTQIWHSSDPFMNLLRSVCDTCQFYAS
jgi:hypothetical protein